MSRDIIISATSDIGVALARKWLADGHQVAGTYRTRSSDATALEEAGAKLVHCDLASRASIVAACEALNKKAKDWDTLVVAPGTQEPIGPFADCDFDEWEQSVTVNFVAQLRVVHALLPTRNRAAPDGPLVLMFAGGGTNNATANYSAYTISKIASIKMCELLDFEIPDTRFAIVGPGWVKTKIHEATLRAKERAGRNYQYTIQKLAGDECTPMEEVVACCEWLVRSPRDVIGGRNFSTVFDAWDDPRLDTLLREDHNMYKLRRHGNGRLVRPRR